MKIHHLTITALAGALSMWALAGVWHQWVMARFYAEQAHASHQGVGIIFLAYVVLSALMVVLYSTIDRRGRPGAAGLMLGLLVGILWVFPHGLAMAGAHGESIPYVFKNTAWHLVEQGFGGLVIGLVYGALRARAGRGDGDAGGGGDR